MSLLKKIQSEISRSSDSPYLDGLVLLSHITNLPKSHLLAHLDIDLSPEQQTELEEVLDQLRSGIPLPYALGQWEFFQLPFNINPDVLIPRPETEGLVERALEWLNKNPIRTSCLELGTGSGCIAVALAKNKSDIVITASDLSPKALEVARENSRLHDLDDRIDFIESDLLDNIKGSYDLLIANLPYIPSLKLLSLKVLKTEPQLALEGGPDGLSYIKKVLNNAREVLNPGALILLELDEDCGPQTLNSARKAFPSAEIHLEQDLAGLDRYLKIQT